MVTNGRRITYIMKKINKYCLLTIITLGIFFFGGNIILNDNISKGINEILIGTNSEKQLQNDDLLAGVLPGKRWAGAGLNSIPCGAELWVNSCNIDSCVVIYNSKEYYLPRAELRETKPYDECKTSRGTNTTKKPTSQTPSNSTPVVVPVSDKTENYRYSQGAIAYSDAKLQDGKFTVPCGDKVVFQDIDGITGMTKADIDAACKYGNNNGYCKVMYQAMDTIYIERAKLGTGEPYCEEDSINNPIDNPSNEPIEQNSYYYINDYDNPNYTGSTNELSCGDKVYISICIDSNGVCYVEKINGKSVTDTYVKKAALQKSASGLNCEVKDEEDEEEIEETEKCNPVKPSLNQTSNKAKQIKICYTRKKNTNSTTAVEENENEVFTCKKSYRKYMEEIPSKNTCKKLNKSSEDQVCSKVFKYSCTSVLKPTLEGGGSLVRSDGKGTLTIKGKDSLSGSGLKGYFLYTENTPTINSIPEQFTGNNYEVTRDVTPGTYFVSVMTNDGVISYPLTLSVHDDEITTTAQIILGSPNGNINYTVTSLEKGKIGYESNITSSDYVRLSNQLNNDSILASGFDLFTTGYEVTVDADQIAVYATLKSTDARYVEGYGNRTVDLNYGRNVILVKIINNKGRERTYTFVVNRTDNRENNNVLSNLTTSVGKLNFDPYVSDYTISVPKNANSVTINGTLASLDSAFVEGYQPRVVTLDNDITSAIIKTISEAGIIRNYILTFVKNGAEVEENYSNSVSLSSLSIAGIDLRFDKDNLSYSASIDYEIEDLTVFAFAESPNAIVDIRGNYGLQVGPNKIEILVTNGSLSKMYNVFINRKEDGLNVSSNTKLETLTVTDYDLLFNPDVEDYSIKIKREKTLLLTATPQSDRSEVYMYGNNDLTAYSTIRIKVIAENGDTGLYSVDIIKDLYDKQLETTAAIVGGIIIFGAVIIIMVRKKRKSIKDYVEV